MKKNYESPFTGLLKLECPAYTCRPTTSSAVDPAPMRHVGGPTQSAGILYI